MSQVLQVVLQLPALLSASSRVCFRLKLELKNNLTVQTYLDLRLQTRRARCIARGPTVLHIQRGLHSACTAVLVPSCRYSMYAAGMAACLGQAVHSCLGRPVKSTRLSGCSHLSLFKLFQIMHLILDPLRKSTDLPSADSFADMFAGAWSMEWTHDSAYRWTSLTCIHILVCTWSNAVTTILLPLLKHVGLQTD